MHLYRGCCHGYIYCDSRSGCYHIQEFDQVVMKANGMEVLQREFLGKCQKGVMGIGAISDPDNPLEKEREMTRKKIVWILLSRPTQTAQNGLIP